MKSKDLLVEIMNEQLSSIEFVQDYLQLHFEDKTLTCYIWPLIEIEKQEYQNNHIDYKNQLCSLISKKITDYKLIERKSLILLFPDESKIILSLDPNNPEIVGEIAILSDNENNWSVFQ